MAGTYPAGGRSPASSRRITPADKFLRRMSLPGIGDIEKGSTTSAGRSPAHRADAHRGKQLEQRKFDADFYEDLKPGDRYASITTVEKTTFGGRPVFKIRLVRHGGDEDTEFYDSETGLKAGTITTRDSPMGPMQGTTAFSDYKVILTPRRRISVMNTQMIWPSPPLNMAGRPVRVRGAGSDQTAHQVNEPSSEGAPRSGRHHRSDRRGSRGAGVQGQRDVRRGLDDHPGFSFRSHDERR
jgi:hypothetical protein